MQSTVMKWSHIWSSHEPKLFLGIFFHSLIPRCAYVLMIALAWICISCHRKNPSIAECREIHRAVTQGHLEEAKSLLSENHNLIICKDNYGLTSLHWAAMVGNKDMAILLLGNGADVNNRTNDSQTPLHLAAFVGHKDMVELLLTYKADVNAKQNDGNTPLHNAAMEGNKEVVEILLAYKSDVNAKSKSGLTPLHWAAEQGHNEIAELLRQHGGEE
jgi:cytohesin